ncbi:MAG: hypothetical protein JO158_05225, partial [Gammaproteobacteria bacterium]|nr:hypothetical protein [Gammaproteobacteria bacterium]
EPERAVGARVTQRVQLTAAAQEFLASPDEAEIEEDLAWLASSGTRILLASGGIEQITQSPCIEGRGAGQHGAGAGRFHRG